MGERAATTVTPPEDYARLLADVRGIIATYRAVGERIVREEQGGADRAAYGEGTMAQLGRALGRDFGRGPAERSLRYMRRFYPAYPIPNAARS